jgi:hypothetical protein
MAGEKLADRVCDLRFAGRRGPDLILQITRRCRRTEARKMTPEPKV